MATATAAGVRNSVPKAPGNLVSCCLQIAAGLDRQAIEKRLLRYLGQFGFVVAARLIELFLGESLCKAQVRAGEIDRNLTDRTKDCSL